jgi:hypothetical protein
MARDFQYDKSSRVVVKALGICQRRRLLAVLSYVYKLSVISGFLTDPVVTRYVKEFIAFPVFFLIICSKQGNFYFLNMN